MNSDKNDFYTIRPIAYMRSDYKEKFGVPRQSGLVTELEQAVVIAPPFRNIDAVRDLEGFSYIWLIWGFSKTAIDMTADPVEWSPTARPPRLGGKVRKGVWATRSPYRPNSLGMSSVRVLRVELDGKPVPQGCSGETNGELAIIVSGADLVDGTPVYDIKPYMASSDSHPDAELGFTNVLTDSCLEVVFPEELLSRIDEKKRAGLIHVLSLDPRGAYEKQPGYTYGLSFADSDIKFEVNGDVLTVTDVVPLR